MFPDFELPDHRNRLRRLSELQGAQNFMIVTLGRGVYCPKERQFLRQLVDFASQLAVGYTRIVTITTDTFVGSNDLRLGVGAPWPFLHDTERLVQRELDIAEYTDPTHDPMVPHTFVLGLDLEIFKIYNGYWYWGRPSTTELHSDLRQLNQLTRFDCDLGSPEVKKEWEVGDRDRFYPYGRPFQETLGQMGVTGE